MTTSQTSNVSQVKVVGWRDRILQAHPGSDPRYWPDALLVQHMTAEIADLRASLQAAGTGHRFELDGQQLDLDAARTRAVELEQSNDNLRKDRKRLTSQAVAHRDEIEALRVKAGQVLEVMRFEYRHPNGESHTIQVSREDVLQQMPEFLFEALCAKFCHCEPIGETNVVECSCDEYAEEFQLLAAIPAQVVPKWQPLTGPGQVKKGDLLQFTLSGKEIEAPAQLIINEGTGKEEIVYNRGKNHYFITSMAVDGTSLHRSVMVKRPNGSPVSEAELAELKRDAARYRWVKQRAWYVDRAAEVYELDRVRGSAFREPIPVDDDDVESAIDAAMQSAAHDEIEEGRDG
ncbi:hypothetical protein [Pseudomonas aeruginosa]|uniref:hypothetical protein n=1 Tax=Pseudomonas aeruginosa TaxID=287 RepID=UPI00287FC4AE|nr:hypothetical protein [Pseudomonas aeruginosa]